MWAVANTRGGSSPWRGIRAKPAPTPSHSPHIRTRGNTTCLSTGAADRQVAEEEANKGRGKEEEINHPPTDLPLVLMVATMLRTVLLPSKAGAAATTRSGRRRLLFLLLLLFCSPILVPLVCLCFPLLLCFAVARLCSGSAHPRPLRREDLMEMKGRDPPAEADGGWLLQRYLEDQVRLVAEGGGSDNCGGGFED